MDWTKAGDYPAAGDLDATQWGWEFLRRSPAYRAAYAEWDRHPRKWDGCPAPSEVLCAEFRIEPWPPNPDGPLPDGVCFSDLASDDSSPPWRIADRQDLESIRFPADPPPPGCIVSEWEAEPEESRVVFVFDVSQSIDTQLAAAKRTLQAERELLAMKIRRKRHADKKLMPRYIRLLDADADGADLATMAEVFHPGESNDYATGSGNPVSKKISAAMKTAKRIRDRDYWKI